MDRQKRKDSILKSIRKLGFDEASLKEIAEFVGKRLHELSVMVPWEKKLAEESLLDDVFAKLSGTYSG